MIKRLSRLLIILLNLLICIDVQADSETLLKEVDKSIRLREYAQAVSRLQPLLQQNNPQAQYRMAGFYRSGKGVTADLDRAIQLYQQAANNGLAEAQYTLASLLEKQHGSRRNSPQVLKLYQDAADQGYARAIKKLDALNRRATAQQGRAVSSEHIFSTLRNNDIEQLNALIRRGIDMNIYDNAGRSPLMVALLAGYAEMSSTLLPLVNDLNQPDINLDRPIHIATQQGYRKLVKALIDRQVDINVQDKLGNSALIIATRHDDAGLVELLVKNGADTGLRNKKDLSAPLIARQQKLTQVQKVFARHGIAMPVQASGYRNLDIKTFQNRVNKSASLYAGWPLINIASLLGENEIVDQLIKQGSDINAKDATGNTALHRAASKGHLKTLELLISAGCTINALNDRQETALYLAAEAGQLKAVQRLLNKGADGTIVASNGFSPLSMAIVNRHEKTAGLLLSAKLDNISLHHALMLAIQYQMLDLSSDLIKLDGLLNQTDNNGRSVLWHSASLGLQQVTRELLKIHKLDINQADNNGYTPLARAIFNSHSNISRQLLNKGASVKAVTGEGNTLLMLSVSSGQKEMVQQLITKEINIDAKNNSGDTALMLAAASGQNEIIKMLIDADANIQTRNQDELNAYQIAQNAGHKESAELIRQRSGKLFQLFN